MVSYAGRIRNSVRRALAGGEVGQEIVGKKFECAFNGRTGHSDEIAKAFTFVKSENFSELLENRLAALPLLNFFQQRRESIGFHPASGALAAGFHSEKLRNPQNFLNNATSFRDKMNDAATEC